MQLASRSTGELFFGEHDLIVSKTDLKGRITYANPTFCQLAGYTEAEILGKPHSVVRHADMPRAVFKLLWDGLNRGQEVFAYVKNKSRTGGYYWVFAHVTPSTDPAKGVVGYHSNRRVPDRVALEQKIIPLYAQVLQAERSQTNGQMAVAAGFDCLTNAINAAGKSYEAYIFSH